MTIRRQIDSGHYYIILLLLIFFSGGQASSDDILEQKQELERIKQDIDNSQKALDSIKNVEKSVLKEISNYDQQASANQSVLKRLNNRLGSIRKSAEISKEKLETSQESYKSAEGRYLSNLIYYYTGSSGNESAFAEEIEIEKNGFRKMVYLKALAAFDKENLAQSSQYLAEAEMDYSHLKDEEKLVGDAQKKKKSEFVILSSHKEKKERDLSKLRLKKDREADRLLTLSEAARQMEDLVARLEKERLARQESDIQTKFDFSTGNFASYKGNLLSPIKGKVTSGFGWKTDKITNLKSFSPGIEITGQKKSSVNSVAGGVIAYIGELRGYGNFLIVEHEDGYYSMYSGLENLLVEENQMINTGEKLGNAPTGIIKFELRMGREPVDPIEWIKIDAF